MAESELIIAFNGIYDDPKFVIGFEAGMIFKRMEDQESSFEVQIHAENKNIVRQMSEKMGYSCTITKYKSECYNEWCICSLIKKSFSAN